jgi:hypothetical protein
MTPVGARATLHALGIDPERRPQTLTLAEWIALYGALESSNSGDTIRA